MSKSLVDFYKENKISPVRQDISNLKAHFEKRASLYRLLGIVPSLVKGKSILEVGPGGGFNAVFTASLQPAKYHLVEGNPTGIEHIKEQLGKYPEVNQNIEIFCSLLEDYQAKEQYDLVICEGMLSGVPKPKETLSLLKKFVKPAGVLIITTIDQISYFPDTLRRLVAQVLIKPKSSIEEQTKLLLPIFRQHFKNLQGMNRPLEDWIIDNLINPASIGPLLSIPDSIETLEDEFEFYNSSPSFVTDWRWYKQLPSNARMYNQKFLSSYWSNAHNFIDYSQILPPQTPTFNTTLEHLSRQFRNSLRYFEDLQSLNDVMYKDSQPYNQSLNDMMLKLSDLEKHIKPLNKVASSAIQEILFWLKDNERSIQYLDSCQNFQNLFGRGQQYLSFIKNHD